MIYLDNAATTKMDNRVLTKMMPWLTEDYGNPGALYLEGRKAKAAIENAREEVARLINCDPDQIIFTSGGSEANNLAIRGFLEARGGVIISTTEHDSVWSATECPEYHRAEVGAISNGRIAASNFVGIPVEYYDLVSVMYINNEIGTINPVKDIAAYCHEHKLAFHTDCVQALGSVKVDVKDIDCDLASFSSHKIHGPKGVGALYVKNKDRLRPIVAGGANQEYGLRGGTENVAGIVGFGEACRILNQEGELYKECVAALNKEFIDTLGVALHERGIADVFHINGATDERSTSKIINVRFDGIDAQSLVLMLDNNGVCVSAGSACHSHSNEPSRTLTAIGLTPDEARSSIRISFSSYNTLREVRAAANRIAECVDSLKNITR